MSSTTLLRNNPLCCTLSHLPCLTTLTTNNSDTGECDTVNAMQAQGQRGAAIAPSTVFLKDYDARYFAEKARCAVGGGASTKTQDYSHLTVFLLYKQSLVH